MKKPNVVWRFFFRVTVALARWAGFDTIDCGKRLSITQEEWVISQGYRVYDAEQNVAWSDHMIFIGK